MSVWGCVEGGGGVSTQHRGPLEHRVWGEERTHLQEHMRRPMKEGVGLAHMGWSPPPLP